MFAKSESNKKIDNRTNNDLPLYMWMSCYVLSLINLARKQAFLESATRLCAHRHSSTSKAAGELFLRSSSKNSVFFLAATRIQKGRKRRKRKLVFSRSLTVQVGTQNFSFFVKKDLKLCLESQFLRLHFPFFPKGLGVLCRHFV